MISLNKTTQKILAQLAKQINQPGQPPVPKRINLTPKRYEYYFRLPIKERIELHEELQMLFERHECAIIEFGPVALGEVGEINAVQISDPYQFLKAISQPCLYNVIESANEHLEALDLASDWLRNAVKDSILDWRRGRLAFGVKPGDVDRLIDTITVLNWLVLNENQAVPDMRTLSVQLFGDSKRIEAITGTIAKAYAPQLPKHMVGSDAKQVLDYLGIRKFAPMIKIKGAFEILMPAGEIDCSNAQPYLGFPPDAIAGIRANCSPSYVLFIENETTFNRYTREVQDDGWVLYTNGFPSRSWAPIFRELVEQAGPQTPVYHWGDIDVGGYRILVHMQAILARDLRPYCMTPEAQHVTNHTLKTIYIRDLYSVLTEVSSPAIKRLAEALIILQESRESVPWIEQEWLELRAPSVITKKLKTC